MPVTLVAIAPVRLVPVPSKKSVNHVVFVKPTETVFTRPLVDMDAICQVPDVGSCPSLT